MRGRRAARESGAVLVEFALILPIFVALVFGIISYGYMLSYRQALGQAASEAARAAAVVPSGMADADRDARARGVLADSLTSYGVSCAGTALTDGATTVGSCAVDPQAPCPADAARSCAIVTVTHQYRQHPLIPSFPGLGITLPDALTYTAVVEVS